MEGLTMSSYRTITGGLCPECYKFGMRKIGTEPAGKNTFRNIMMCQFCGHKEVK